MNLTHVSRRRGLLAALCCLAVGAGATAAPRDELLRLVPDDMTFCVVVQDLRERARVGKDSALAMRMARMPIARAKVDSPEFKKILDARDQVLKEFQLTPEQIRDDLLGDAIVFAYRQGPGEKPDQEQGLFLLWARDKALLARVVDRFNEMQKKSGELKELQASQHQGRAYTRRVKGNGNEYYFLRDNVLVFTSQEAALKSAIDRDLNQAAADKQAPFWSKMLTSVGVEKALAALLVNPRVFDEALAAQEKAAAGAEKAFLTEFRRHWQAFDGLAVYSDFAEHFELGLAFHVRTEALPKASRQLFAGMARPSALWKVIPDDPLFALSARTELATLAEVFAGFGDETALKEVRTAVQGNVTPFLPEGAKIDALLNGLGPDWGFWSSAPPTAEKAWVPDTILAVRVRDTAEGAAAETTVRNVVGWLLPLAQLASKGQLRVDTVKHDKLEIRTLSHQSMFPAGFRPSFATKDGFLVFAGSPETIKRFAGPGKDEPKDAGEAPILRVSSKGWRDYLSAHKAEVAEFIAKASGATAKDVLKPIDEAIENFKAFDRLEVVVKSKPNQASIAVRLTATPSKP